MDLHYLGDLSVSSLNSHSVPESWVTAVANGWLDPDRTGVAGNIFLYNALHKLNFYIFLVDFF